MKLYEQFNKNCESFRNFDEAIRRDSTRRSYHYNLNEFMRFAKLDDYDKLAKQSTDAIQKFIALTFLIARGHFHILESFVNVIGYEEYIDNMTATVFAKITTEE